MDLWSWLEAMLPTAVVTSNATAMLAAGVMGMMEGMVVVAIAPKICGVTIGGAGLSVVVEAMCVRTEAGWPTTAAGIAVIALATAATAFGPANVTTVAVGCVFGWEISLFVFLVDFLLLLGGPLFFGPLLQSLQRCL